jgi:uncharacterized membrane protein YcaP (DUF421 family)
MLFLWAFLGIDLNQLLLGGEDWDFLIEVITRTMIMLVVILISLRVLGKRAVKQLSIFEIAVIIGLGSAAGDPMFYKDAGILPAIIVFTMTVGVYKLITYIIGKSKRFEDIMEGKPICLIKDGAFSIKNFEKESMGEDEFFSELRMQSVSQLGQIEIAIQETSGDMSIIFYPDEEVKFGLPIMPDSLDAWQQKISDSGYYACIFCGYTEKLKPTNKCNCPQCNKTRWVKATNKKRIS